jgi:hypothetical protein
MVLATKKVLKPDPTAVDLLKEISEKLDNILGFLAVRGVEGEDEIVLRLAAFGMGPKAISRVTGDTENAVGLRLMRLRRKAEQKVVKKAGKKGGSKGAVAPAAMAQTPPDDGTPAS